MLRIFRSLSSVKLTLILLILLILLSIIGTLIPQGQELSFYQKYFPRLTGLILFIKFDHLYRSELFLSLVLLFLLNLIFCSARQLGSKIKRLQNESEFFSEASSTLEEKKIRTKVPADLKFDPNLLISALEKKRYQPKISEEKDRTTVFARKGVFGLFGPEIVHLGLVIIIIGGLVSAFLSYRRQVALVQGKTAEIPGRNISLRLDKFTTEYYPNGAVKSWKSAVSVIEDNQVRATSLIEVNHPFKYRDLSFFQMSYGQDWDSPSIELEIKTKDQPIRTIATRPGETSKIDDNLSLRVLNFVPDFQIDSSGQVVSRSAEPNNPAALVEIQAERKPVFSGWVFYLYPDFTRFHRKTRTDLEITIKKFEAPVFSVLEASSDPGTSLVWIGSMIMMLGLFASFYLPYRELRILIEANGQTKILPYARKNREGFFKEIEEVLESLNRK